MTASPNTPDTPADTATPDDGPLYLPGDPPPDEDVERMIRVDHAGE